MSALQSRKQRGDYPTPPWLVELVAEQATAATADDGVAGREVVVVDPACGDGRFLAAAARRLDQAGATATLFGCDIDPDAVAAARRVVGPAGRIEHADALERDWSDLAGRVDVVVGNPPYLSQLAASTSRGGASRHGGGPYADAAVEFLALAGRLVRPIGGRLGLVLPQSILASRDAAPVRAELDRVARIVWSWWSPQRVFDAQVLVCAVVAETGSVKPGIGWTDVVTRALGVPAVPPLAAAGVLGDRCRVTANFRDQYYGLVPAVVEDGDGPRLVSSGLLDPGRCWWGERPIRFARRSFHRPTVELDRLSPAMLRWAAAMAVPKVLVANQTRVIEAAVDTDGSWLPGVPALTVRPAAGVDPWAVAAVLTSPVASAWAWHRAAGTGLSATALRLGPRWLAELPWPAGSLDAAVAALRAGDVVGCGAAVTGAYGLGQVGERRGGAAATSSVGAAGPASPGGEPERLVDWWRDAVPATSSQPA